MKKTSTLSWAARLKSLLLPSPTPQPTEPAARIALVGIGNEFNGDDAAGVYLIRRLARFGKLRSGVLLLEGGLAPENLTGALRNFAAELVVMVDAGNFGAQPGAVAVFDWQDLSGFSGSTHILPPSVLARFLVETLGCQVAVVAIQAGQTEFDRPMTPAVRRAVAALARFFAEALLATPPSRLPDPR